jgi:hypothetical protein
MLKLDTAGHLFPPAKALTVAQTLQADDDEGWTYTVVHDPTGIGYSFIMVYDEHGEHVGKF